MKIHDFVWKIKLTFNKLLQFLFFLSISVNLLLTSVEYESELKIVGLLVLLVALIQIGDDRKDRQMPQHVLVAAMLSLTAVVYLRLETGSIKILIFYLIELLLTLVTSLLSKPYLFPSDKLK